MLNLDPAIQTQRALHHPHRILHHHTHHRILRHTQLLQLQPVSEQGLHLEAAWKTR
jgi:hypothetical protein